MSILKWTAWGRGSLSWPTKDKITEQNKDREEEEEGILVRLKWIKWSAKENMGTNPIWSGYIKEMVDEIADGYASRNEPVKIIVRRNAASKLWEKIIK